MMRPLNTKWIVLLPLTASALAGAFTLGANAQKPTAPPKTTPAPKPQPKEIPPAKVLPPPEIAAGKKDAKPPKKGQLDWEDWKHDDATNISTGRSFRYQSEDAIITGDNARYHTEKQYLWGDGHIEVDSEKYHITCNKAEVDDSKKKFALLTENVVMTLKPKKKDPNATTPPAEGEGKSASDERSRGVVIHCDRVESEYKKKIVRMYGNLVFHQKVKKKDGTEIERTLYAEHAEYDDKAEKMHLFKPVRGKDSEGQEIEFETDVFVGTKEGAETLESKGKVRISVIQKDEEDEETDKTAPKNPETKPGEKEPPPAKPPQKRK